MIIDNNFYIDHCPFCKSNKIVIRGNINYPKNLLFSTTRIGLKKQPLFCYCNNCNSGFTNNIIRDSVASKLYKVSDSSCRWNQGNNFEEIKPKEICKFLEKSIHVNDSVLDIGSNRGELLDYCKSNMKSTTIAYELSENSIIQLEKKGHKVVKDLKDIESESIDIVCLFDVVEHLYNFEVLIKQLYSMLRKRGKVIILTGNVNSLSAKLSGSRWWYLNAPEHIRFPSIRYLKELREFKYLNHKKVYNSYGYKSTFIRKIKTYVKLILLNKKNEYNGIPLLSGDHYIIKLEKR